MLQRKFISQTLIFTLIRLNNKEGSSYFYLRVSISNKTEVFIGKNKGSLEKESTQKDTYKFKLGIFGLLSA